MEQGESSRPHRRFGLGDRLILLAALALTLAALRANGWFDRLPGRLAFWWETSLDLLRIRTWNLGGLTRAQGLRFLAIQVTEEILVQLLSSVLFGLTLAQPVLRLRRPRPPLREVIRQSGLAACLGVILLSIVSVDILWMTGTDVTAWILPALPFALLWPICGLYPWRTEASWIDRLGRAVGWGWVIAIGSVMALFYLA
jgi:hypothetical protein